MNTVQLNHYAEVYEWAEGENEEGIICKDNRSNYDDLILIQKVLFEPNQNIITHKIQNKLFLSVGDHVYAQSLGWGEVKEIIEQHNPIITACCLAEVIDDTEQFCPNCGEHY